MEPVPLGVAVLVQVKAEAVEEVLAKDKVEWVELDRVQDRVVFVYAHLAEHNLLTRQECLAIR
jgi:hypothetical protein